MFVSWEPALNSSIVHQLDIVSSTKDSIFLKWNVEEDFEPHVQGFKVRYQAVGSTVVQYSHLLKARVTNYEILQLHENTYYDICVKVYTNMTNVEQDAQCVQATTATDSLSVALGSTFGAFLALGVIVFFVFIAKWNHTRKLKRQLQQVPPSGDSFESLEKPGEADIEMSDVSLQVHDETVKLEMSSQSSLTTVANGVQPGGQSNHVMSDNDTREISRDKAIPSTSSGSSQENKQETTAESALLLPPPGSSPTEQATAVKPEITDRPPDVRPKTTKQNRPLVDLTHAYQNKPHRSSQRDRERTRDRDRDRDRRTSVRSREDPAIRPNQSCPNW